MSGTLAGIADTGSIDMSGRIRVASKEDRTMDGIVFHSKREMLRYADLKLLVRCGTILDLELQPAFPLIINGVKVCTYIADFRYKDLSGRTVIEDVKGWKTESYVFKSNLFHALNPDLRILET